MRRCLTALLASALACAPLLAEGETGASFLNVEAGAEAAALGGAVVSLPASAGNVTWNPGSLGWLRGLEFTASHAEYVQATRCQHLAAAYGIRKLALAFSLQALTLGGMEERTEPSASPLSTFGATFLAPAITCARQFGPRLSVGTSLRLVHQRIGNDQASTLANDLGVSVLTGIEGLGAGASLTNWGGGIRFADRSQPLPTRLRLGASYDMLDGALAVSGDLVKPRDGALFPCLGVEGSMWELVRVRAGYRGGLSDAGSAAGLSGGLGVMVGGYEVDYAASSRGELGLAHCFSLTFSPGAAANARAERTIAAELQRRARVTAESFYKQGSAHLRAGRPEEAAASFDLALVWDPDFAEASNSLAEAQSVVEEAAVARLLASGLAHYHAGRQVDAIADFGRLLEIRPKHQAAREWLQKASEDLAFRRPGPMGDSTAAAVDRHLKSGAALLSSGDFARAMGEWDSVLALAPGHATAMQSRERTRALLRHEVDSALVRAQALGSQGRWSAALAQSNRALVLEPDNPAALAKQAEARAALKRESEAHARTGSELAARGEYARAEAELRMALSLDRENRAASEQLARIGSQRSRANAQLIGDLYLKGISAYTQEDYAQAAALWQRVVELDPDHANARRNLERAREKMRILGQ